jgi:hypothetical protein
MYISHPKKISMIKAIATETISRSTGNKDNINSFFIISSCLLMINVKQSVLVIIVVPSYPNNPPCVSLSGRWCLLAYIFCLSQWLSFF